VSRNSKNVHVVPVGSGRFAVKQPGNPVPLTPPGTQKQAIDAAKPLATLLGGDVVIHGRDGLIRDRDSYGNDPFPPRDRKH
jgi:Uncharacterized protein conserved in bacteria (DUF2188)